MALFRPQKKERHLEDYRYDVFLSHNSNDKQTVEKLAIRLEEEVGLKPYLDKWHLVPGQPWQEELEKALDSSATCAVFLGPCGLGPWQNEEMRVALDERVRKNSFRVIPVLLPGAELKDEAALPRFLHRLTWVDFRTGLDDHKVFNCLVAGIQGRSPGRQSITINKGKVQWVIVLSGTIEDEDKAKVEAIVEHLHKLSGDMTLTVRKIESGSVKLIIESSAEGRERIVSLFEERALREIADMEVLEINVTTRFARFIESLKKWAPPAIGVIFYIAALSKIFKVVIENIAWAASLLVLIATCWLVLYRAYTEKAKFKARERRGQPPTMEKVPQFPKLRKWALAGMILLPILTLVSTLAIDCLVSLSNIDAHSTWPAASWVAIAQALSSTIALLVSVVTNVIVGAWAIYKYLDGKKEKRRADLGEESLKEVGEELIERVGYQIGAIEVVFEILNLDGDCDTRWAWKGIRKVRDDVALDQVPGRMRFSTPGCSFSQPPKLLTGYTSNYHIEFVNDDIRLCEFNVRVKHKNLDEINYEYGAGIYKAVIMWEEELVNQRYKYEWFGFHVISVIETLTIKLFFPKHYQPDDVQPDVCIGWGPTDLSDFTEIERIRNYHGFINMLGEALLTVSKPKIGYYYFIRWTPLPQRGFQEKF